MDQVVNGSSIRVQGEAEKSTQLNENTLQSTPPNDEGILVPSGTGEQTLENLETLSCVPKCALMQSKAISLRIDHIHMGASGVNSSKAVMHSEASGGPENSLSPADRNSQGIASVLTSEKMKKAKSEAEQAVRVSIFHALCCEYSLR
ncbi:unnamed protein product [Echinostoma caproni]|uniref:UHRF1-binding protein 1-like n=1 Tax=Echinostoma caproni TaxID=27848 RepID=A0A183B4L0_9TREM|nr:unnamed protein product [Echinostoma caproni]